MSSGAMLRLSMLLFVPRVMAVFFFANLGPSPFSMGKLTIEPGDFKQTKKGPSKKKFLVEYNGVKHKIVLAEGTAGRHTGLLMDAAGVHPIDTNDLQVALAKAAEGCAENDFACVAEKTWGGVATQDFVTHVFMDTWMDWSFWSLCVAQQPAPIIRTVRTRTGHQLQVFREFPMVAAVRGFGTEQECQQLIQKSSMRDLTMAHVGGNGGGTSTSASRETLTNSLWVDWNDEHDILSQVASRMFDLASDLLEADVPYEGQEPINFLHYIKGYEYRPHHDGSGYAGADQKPPTGKRIGTTLMYCEAPDEGGSTVFTNGKTLKFQPGRGDILFFAYNPDPNFEAEHAACPVFEGNKTTLTQWYRLGVSNERNWDNFENWGKFHNPHIGSVWKGPRFSVAEKTEL